MSKKSQTYQPVLFPINPKDKKISELRSKLDSLKDRSKDYDSLNSQYKQLLVDFSLMNEAKQRLEYEIKQRESEYNRRISDLKSENETLKLGLNDKMTNSKKIFSENDIIEREIELKKEEIKNLNERLSNISFQYDKDRKKKNDLVEFAQNLHDDIIKQSNQICKLKEDNICLTKICQENEKYLRLRDNDIHELSNELTENDYDLQNLNNKVNINENNLNKMKNKYNSINEMNIELSNNINKMEKEFDELRNENNLMKNELINERALRIELGNNNEKLNNILIQRERILNQINHDNENIKLINAQYKNRKDTNKIQNEKLKNQVNILENQNLNLIKEIDNILDEDRRMKEIISRKTRITSLLQNNNDTLERSLNNLDKNNDNYSYEINQQSSPRFTYHCYDYDSEHKFI